MKELLKSIEPLVNEELERANEKFPQFVDAHHGYAVIKEEYEETYEELEKVKVMIDGLWHNLRRNQVEKYHVKEVKKYAISTAAESIQVAAMAQKFMDMMEREGK